MDSQMDVCYDEDGFLCPFCEKPIEKPLRLGRRIYCPHCGKRIKMEGYDG